MPRFRSKLREERPLQKNMQSKKLQTHDTECKEKMEEQQLEKKLRIRINPKCNKAADLFSATHTTIHLTNIASSSHVNKFRAVKLQSDWFRNPKNQQSRHLCVCSLNVTLCKVAYFLIVPAVCTLKDEKMILISA